MEQLIRTKITFIWGVLTALTITSWLLADGYETADAAIHNKYVSIGLFLIAFFKIRLVIMNFMEIDTAPVTLRILFESWMVIVCTTLIILYCI